MVLDEDNGDGKDDIWIYMNGTTRLMFIQADILPRPIKISFPFVTMHQSVHRFDFDLELPNFNTF